MSSRESFNLPEITPDMREHTSFLRELQAPEHFEFVGNFTIDSFDGSITPATQVVRYQQRKFGHENVFASDVAYSEDGSVCEDALAIYRREGAEPIPIRTRVIRKLGSLARR